MLYRDDELGQALADIANRKKGWEERAPSICARAMYRITELENAWDDIRTATARADAIAQNPEIMQP